VHNIHAYVLPCNERNIPVCCKFTQLHSRQILLKLVNIWLSYREKQKGELFLKHSACIYSVFQKKTEPLQLISHNFTNSQRSLIIFGTEILYSILHYRDKKFLNWLKTSCVISMTTAATWRTWTADFWAGLKQRYHRQGNKGVAKRSRGSVNAERQHSYTCCNF